MELGIIAIADLWAHWLWPILLFILGLGAVVFVHELGHFLVAKFVGIKVERFALGFGPRLVGLKRGDTDYCICALPLGGYVKMLGQEDFKPTEEEEQPDPRSYNAKSVGQRFAVIAAGVVMNVIFAGVLFLIISMVGKDFAAPYVGSVTPGYAAAQAEVNWQDDAPPEQDPLRLPAPASGTTSMPATAPADGELLPIEGLGSGLESGDRIIAIHGPSLTLKILNNRITTYDDVTMVSLLADPGEVYTFTIQRIIDGKTYTGKADLEVTQSPGRPAIGVNSAQSTIVARAEEVLFGSPLQPGDKIVAINGRPVEHGWEIERIEDELSAAPATVTVERVGEDDDEVRRLDFELAPTLTSGRYSFFLTDGRIIRGRISNIEYAQTEQGAEVHYQIAPPGGGDIINVPQKSLVRHPLTILGLQPRLKVAGIQKDSPADEAGLKPGDIVISYGDQSNPTMDQFMDITGRLVNEGVRLVVLRDGEQKTLNVVPKEMNGQPLTGTIFVPDTEHLVVANVLAGSPAERLGITPGSRIVAVNGQAVETWLELYRVLGDSSGQPMTLSLAGQDAVRDVEVGVLSTELFWAGDYRLSLLNNGHPPLEPMVVEIRETNPLKALAWGGRETIKWLVSTYASFGSLAKGNVGTDTLSGPIGIGAIAIEVGRRGVMYFVHFMAIISVALAVFNFLPIPVVDGGHAVFLLIEKVRGRPLPVKVMNTIQVIGMILILGVFVVVTWNDIMRLVSGSW
jgi:regulator of sigma E protease